MMLPSPADDFGNANKVDENRKRIDALREKFVSYFIKLGYENVPSEPLIPKSDDTVLYSNATITPIKERLLRGERPVQGWVIDQPCLRLQNLSEYPNHGFDPEYMSFFHMVGIYTTSLDDNLVHSIVNALEKCGLTKDRIEIRGCHRDANLIDSFTNLYPEFAREECERDEGYFDWKYDMGAYRGRGIHVMIKQDNGEALSVGQLVEIRDGDNLIGYEFGFGVETFLARLNQKKSIFDLGIGQSSFPKSSDYAQRQYQDLLVSSIAMHCAGTDIGKNGRSAAFRKAINQLVTLEFLFDETLQGDSIKEIYNAVSLSAGDGDYIDFMTLIHKQRANIQEKIDRYNAYRSNYLLQASRDDITYEYANEKISQYSNRISLPETIRSKIDLGYDY